MRPIVKIALIALVLALGLSPFLTLDLLDPAPPVTAEARLGQLDAVRAAFARWYEDYAAHGGDREYTLPLGYFDGASTEPTDAYGRVRLDLVAGRAVVEVKRLERAADTDVWLIENHPGSGLLPEPGDRMVRLGSLAPQTDAARLTASLGADFFEGFTPEMAVVTRKGVSPVEGGLLYGAPGAFQSVYFDQRRSWMVRSQGSRSGAGPAALFGPVPLNAQLSISADRQNLFTPDPLDDLVTKGALLFFNGTFQGNGRTCGTCHPHDNNFTIDPQFIATLSDFDPLFVAEPGHPNHVPGLEIPNLLRALGVILENVDGFLPDPTENFTLRGVPHTLALNTSLTADPNDCVGFAEATGWSCDGAPFGGSLKQFAAGAVRQHFTKSLNRDPGTDFEFPNDDELNAMELFQRALGRQSDPVLADLTFQNPIAETGKVLFANSGCNACHDNAGANSTDPGTGIFANHNFATGVERLAAHPADILDPANSPDDGGFDDNIQCLLDPDDPSSVNGFGNCEFNTPTLVEAADTPPFFHNNSVNTLEGAVEFYDSVAFENSLFIQAFGGSVPPIFQFDFDSSQVDAISAFLRVLNAVENIRNVRALGTNAMGTSDGVRRDILDGVIADTQDILDVLEPRGIHLDLLPAVRNAISLFQKAQESSASLEEQGLDPDQLIQEGIEILIDVRDSMVTGTGAPFFP